MHRERNLWKNTIVLKLLCKLFLSDATCAMLCMCVCVWKCAGDREQRKGSAQTYSEYADVT